MIDVIGLKDYVESATLLGLADFRKLEHTCATDSPKNTL